MTETKTRKVASARVLSRIRMAIEDRRRFLITSHTQPDGDSIGSQLAMAFALQRLGKEVCVVNRDPAPPHYFVFPGVSDIIIADSPEDDFDAVIVMECGDLGRTGLTGLDRFFLINIDHHVGNEMYGDINWFDASAAACGEMVMDVMDALGVPLTREIATHIYLAILTDTGSFHHSNITARTFEISRRAADAGVDPGAMARSVFDSNSFGKLKLIGRLLDSMQLADGGHLAVLYLDEGVMRAAGCTYNDTEGLINLPLTARDVQAVVFFKVMGPDQIRVSLRSKGDVNVRSVATQFGGGGHTNAAGFTVQGPYETVRERVVKIVTEAIERSRPAEGVSP